jgi:hypothetical protein
MLNSQLILFGILGAFAVNEWQASRERQARVKTMMTAIQAELESNFAPAGGSLRLQQRSGCKFSCTRGEEGDHDSWKRLSQGLMIRPQLVSAAWDSAQAGGIINDLPVATVLVVATAYENQRDYAQATAGLMDIFCSRAIQQSQENKSAEPGLLGGVLNDYAGRGRRLVRRYQETLAHLRGEPPPAAPK